MTFRPENDPTKPDSVPDYDGFGFDSQWRPSDWISWHRAMRTAYGLDEANRRFLSAWEGGGFFESAPIDARSFDASFKAYARENGFYDALFSGLGVLARPVAAVNDLIAGTTDLTAGVKNTAKTVGFVLPVVVLAVGGFLLWQYLPRKKMA